MTEIRFYHLQTKSLEQALPEILTRALDQGRRAVVRVADAGRRERLNEHLWVFNPDSFLPHAAEGEGFAADQPIWLTGGNDNPNGADILILTSGADAGDVASYKLCCEMLEPGDDEGAAAARGRWKTYQAAGHDVTYWQQNARGGWEKKS